MSIADIPQYTADPEIFSPKNVCRLQGYNYISDINTCGFNILLIA